MDARIEQHEPFAGYAPEGDAPLTGYAALMGVFGAVTAGAITVAKRTGHDLPDRIPMREIALFGVATHKLARTLAKDKVTSPLRAPVTRLQEPAGMGEVEEEVRGGPVREAIGDLVLCPYCLSVWVATGFFSTYLFSPRAARFAASVLGAVSLSDFLQIAYKGAQKRM